MQNKELEDFIYFMIWASYGPSQIILVNTLVGIKEKASIRPIIFFLGLNPPTYNTNLFSILFL